MNRVTVLGLGAMGQRMAERLLGGPWTLVVYNRSRAPTEALQKRGAVVAGSPQEAAEGADLVLSMVTDDAVSQDIWRGESGALPALKPGAVAIECSTVTPGWISELSSAATDAGVTLLDAPVIGTRPQAEAGELVFVVGGATPSIAERVDPVLRRMGSAVHHVGPVGRGATMKLAVNAIFGIQVAALSEVLGFLSRSDLEVGACVDVLSTLAITSPALRGIGSLIASGQFSPMFPIDLVEKDFRYIAEAAEAVDADVPVARAVRSVYQRAVKAGYGADNINAVARLFG